MHSGHAIPANYSQTPTPLPPPPRQVNVGPATTMGMRLILVLIALVGTSALACLIFLFLWALLGVDLPGTITGANIKRGGKGGSYYVAEYSFLASGITRSGSDRVDYATYQRFQNLAAVSAKDRQVQVHYFAIGPARYWLTEEYGSIFGTIVALVLFAVFWNGVIWCNIYQIAIKRRWIVGLVTNGQAVPGTIISKGSIGRAKTYRYFAQYSFRVAETGQEMKGEIETKNVDRWEAAQKGQLITVLYSAAKPWRSTVYELGEFIVEH